MTDFGSTKAGARANWILWWRKDQGEIDRQVRGYGTLGFFKSARKVSVALLIFSNLLTLLLVVFKVVSVAGLLDVALMSVLALFIYRGHGWASVAAMVVWTIEKAVAIFTGLSGASANPGVVASSVVWWCVYMHAFMLSFRVERARRGLGSAKALAETFD